MKRISSLLLAALLLFLMVACGGSSTDQTSSGSTAPSGGVSSGSQQPDPSVSEEEPGETLEEYYERIRPNQAFLTGLPKDEDYPEGQRAVAVSVNNVAAGWPNHGISEAQVLFEIAVEYNVTRLMAIYENYKTVPKVGPVRSLRDQFFQFLIPWWMFVVHDGQSQPTGWMLNDWDYQGFNLDTGIYGGSTTDQSNLNSLAYRDYSNHSEWYTEFTDGAHIEATVDRAGLDNYRSYSTMFNFVSYELEPRVPTGGEAGEVTVVHAPRTFLTYFEYDEATHLYETSMHNERTGRMEPAVDANNNQQCTFTNVLVLFAPFELYPTTVLPKYNYGNGGLGFLFTEGHYEMVRWAKGGPNEALLLYDWHTDEPTFLNMGKTYVGVVKDTYQEDFYNSVVLGTAGEVASGGTVDTSVTDVE